MAIGDIRNIIDSLDFDLYGGVLPKIVHISGSTYAIVYQGYGNDGYLVTISIEASGTIAGVIGSLEFDTSNGAHPWITHIAGDVHAITYVGPGGNGTIKTLTIQPDGTIGVVIDTFVYDSGPSIIEPVIVKISGNVYAVFYGGADNDGWLKTITINNTGTIGGIIDTLEFDTAYGVYSAPIHIGGSIWAVAYTADAIFGPGRIKTISIASNGVIGGITASYDIDSNQTSAPDIMHVSGNVYAIAYGGPGRHGWLKTLSISGGSIGAVIDSMEFEAVYGCNPWVVHVADDVYAIAYDGPDGDGWLKTVSINGIGVIGGEVASLEYDPVDGRYQSMVHVSGNVYAIAYLGPGNDGWLKTVDIETVPIVSRSQAYIIG